MRSPDPPSHRHVVPTAAVLITVLLGAFAAGAQVASSPDLTDISLEDLTHVKVYSASRHLEDSDDAPSAVTVITAEDIRRYGWRTLAEALSSVRGFYTSYDRDYTYLGVLGVLRPGDYNCRILLPINGNRVNENVYGSAPVGSEFPLDIDLVERIEVVRGPASSLFGTNAFFGVINVITRETGKQNALEASGSVSSWMGRYGRLTGTFQYGRFSGLLSGSLYRSDGHPWLYFPEYDSAATSYGIARYLDGESFTHEFADFQYGRVRLQALYSDRTKDLPTAPFGAAFGVPGTYSRDRASYVAASYHRPLSSRTEIDARFYYNVYDYLGTGVYAAPSSKNVRGYDTSSARWAGTEVTLSRQFGRHRVTIGGQYEYSFQIKQATYDAGQTPVVNVDDPQWLAAWYAQAELKLKSKLAINAGLRLDWVNPYGAAVSPRIAAVYRLSSRNSLKYIYTIGLVLKDLLGNLGGHDIRILGTDISNRAVAAASRGHFSDLEIGRGLPSQAAQKHFTREGSDWKISDEIRGMATFRRLNLLEPFSFPAPFDIIFCRNVAIYFSEQDRRRPFNNLSRCMARDGSLIIGSTESLTGLCPSLVPQRYLRTVFYQRET